MMTRPETPIVYWRPGCPFCAKLRASLRFRRVAAEWRNIWDDDDARAFVRAANGGDETVPTVVLGGETLTNPTGRQVKALINRRGAR